MVRFHGVIVPTVTLFHADGSIDWEANHSHIERLIEHGVHGIFVLGTTGEAVHMTVDERKEVIRWAGREFKGRIPLLAGIGDPSTSLACELGKTAREAGMDGVVVISPFFWILSERHLFDHFRTVAEAADMPTFLYNYPAFTGVNLSVPLVRRLVEECPEIVGIKETLDSGTHMRRMVQGVRPVRSDFKVFSGHDDLALFGLSAGLDGMVSSTTNFAPELTVELYERYRRDDFEGARALSDRIGRVVVAHSADPCGPAVVKTALRLRGWIEHPYVRRPALPLTPEGTEGVRGALVAGGILAPPEEGPKPE